MGRRGRRSSVVGKLNGAIWILLTLSAIFAANILFVGDWKGNRTISNSISKEANVVLDSSTVMHSTRALEEEGERQHERVFGASPDDFSATFLVSIVLGLLLLTIMFEFGKEYLEEVVEEDMEPIIEKLYAEMTVLGFLSMVTFLLNEGGFFHYLALLMYHDVDEEEELLEIFEVVHFAIFFIMVLFFVQVVLLIRQAMYMDDQWRQLDRDLISMNVATASDDEKSMPPPASEVLSVGSRGGSKGIGNIWSKLRVNNSFVSLLPFFRNRQTEQQVDTYYFHALRKEFVLDRSMEYPFSPAPVSQRVNTDFNFGRYLGLSLSKFLTRVVDVSNVTLGFFCVGSVIAYLYILAVQENMMVLAWSWLIMGWCILFFHVFFEQHVLNIRRKLVPERRLETFSDVDSVDNSISFRNMDYGPPTAPPGLNMTDKNGDALPAWCAIDIDYYREHQRSWIERTFVRGKPNRMESLFWLDRFGPRLYLLMLQANLIYIGVDFSIQFMYFVPMMYQDTALPVFCVYTGLAILSCIGTIWNKRHLMASLSVVCSVGVFRNLQVLEAVYREEKAENMVRALLIVYRLHHLTNPRAMPTVTEMTPITTEHKQEEPYTERLDQFEVTQVVKIFDAFDRSGNGVISKDEFSDLLNIFGGNVSDGALEKVISTIATEGDGVSKEDFLQWYSVQSTENTDVLKHAPMEIFRLFDAKKNGELTISEFKDKLDHLRLGFTVEEQLVIINELDRDGSGTIGKHEFELLFTKFNPKKLRKNEQEFLIAEMLPDCNALCGVDFLGHTLD